MNESLIDYDYILEHLPGSDIAEIIQILWEDLPGLWCDEYLDRAPLGYPSDIGDINLDGIHFLFDLAPEPVAQDEPSIEPRVVAVYGRSQLNPRSRDASRMKGFLGPSGKVFGPDYDKGHFFAHSIGGGLDMNLFPQRKDINRGWSARGKTFREMEKYCAQNPGTFCFARPIYCDFSWKPCLLEYGIVFDAGALWVERFEN
jgi:hypothetical protein